MLSAVGGKPKTTDLLLGMVQAACRRDEETVHELMNNVKDKYWECLENSPIPQPKILEVKQMIQEDFKSISDVLRTVSLMKWKPDKISHLVSGYGEVWSARVMKEVMEGR